MSENARSKTATFIADRWVSWLIELLVLGVIAFFTIAETRKTAEQTRAMLSKYDATISEYAAQKTEAMDSAAAAIIERTKEKAGAMTKEDVKSLIDQMKRAKPEDIVPRKRVGQMQDAVDSAP